MDRSRKIDVSQMSDTEIDSFFPESQTNTLKSALPLCVYFVLRNHSGPARHLTQTQILRYLEEEYELEVERKALGRCLHTIMLVDDRILSNPRYGSWFQPSETHTNSAPSDPDGAVHFRGDLSPFPLSA